VPSRASSCAAACVYVAPLAVLYAACPTPVMFCTISLLPLDASALNKKTAFLSPVRFCIVHLFNIICVFALIDAQTGFFNHRSGGRT
jgi:hypothetical protein